MKTRDYKESKLKHELIQDLQHEKKEGKNFVYRKFTPNELEKVRKKYEYIPIELLITTRKLANIRYVKNGILKDIHYAYLHHQKILIRKYRLSYVNILNEHHLDYKIKCKIIL